MTDSAMLADQDVQDCLALLEGIPLGDAETVFVSGSRAEGWSSAGSNYNFYVIGEPPPELRVVGGYSVPATDQRIKAHHYVVGDIRVVVYFWSRGDVEWAINAVRLHELRPTVAIWAPAIQFLHRFSIGIPLRHEDRFEALRAKIDLKALARYLTQYSSMAAESYWTDAVTRRAAGRPYDALVQARLAFGCSVDSYLACQGDTNSQEKWRHKRVSRLSSAGQLLADFEEAICGPCRAAGEPALDRFIVTLLHRCETLNCCVQLGCRYEALTIAHPGPAGGGSAIERTTVSRLTRRYDGQVLAARLDGSAVMLSPAAALVYGCADGRRTAGQIARHAAGYLNLPLEQMRTDVDTVVRELSARGFLTDSGDDDVGNGNRGS